ncbi:MAG: APC family permease [Actinomycetota bacterium]
MASLIKRFLLGRPLATDEQAGQRVRKLVALPTFSADAISSTAYASEQILIVVAAGGSSLLLGLGKLVPISLIVAGLLVIVVSSYRQTIFAYPSGGGSYIVSRENLGRYPSLVAAASLLIDYILTVAVSVSAGVAAIVSLPALRGLASQRVVLCLLAIAIITLANLRGLKQSGALFAVPTYTYIATMALLVIYGLLRVYFGHVQPVPFDAHAFEGVRRTGGTLGLLLLLKGFSSGAIALTGVEAISNGVPAFKTPESKNAADTMIWMAIILGGLFFGVSLLAHHLQPYPSREQTLISELGRQVLGSGPVYVALQFATAAILTLAANTAYADFPRLGSIVAKDGFAPRHLSRRGDRLAFSNGILLLACAAAALVVAFGGKTDALVPLYAIGVFTAFTLSQAGMVRHHQRQRERGWRWRLAINAIGAAATLAVLAIIAASKFTSGAWLPIVLVPIIVTGFVFVRRYYDRLDRALQVTPEDARSRPSPHTVVVLVGQVNLGTIAALNYARGLHPEHLVALHVCLDGDDGQSLIQRWAELGIDDVPLASVAAPYRDLGPVVEAQIDALLSRWPGTTVTLVTSQYAGGGLTDDLLHNRRLVLLREQLMHHWGVVVASVPYRGPRGPGHRPAEAGQGAAPASPRSSPG